MASSSIHPPPHALAQIQEDLKYLYASNTNVSNFVSVKLSSYRNYHLWKTQMFSLMETYNLYGIVDATFTSPRGLSPEMEKQYNILVKGWILASISEEVLGTVVDLDCAKDVWEKLKSFYDHTTATPVYEELSLNRKRKQKQIGDKVLSEENITISSEIQTVDEDIKRKGKNKIIRNMKLRQAIAEGNWREVESKLSSSKGADIELIDSDGNTMLHIAVGLRRNRILRHLLEFTDEVNLRIMRNFDGNTPLHIAAIVGNTKAASLLVKKNRRLLEITDHKGEIPLDKAYENMHLDTIEYLLKAANDVDGKSKAGVKVGVNLLVNAVTAKQYDLATQLVKKSPEFVVENDNILLAITRTFPMGLDYWEMLIYPNMGDICERIVMRARDSFKVLVYYCKDMMCIIEDVHDDLIFGPLAMLRWIYYMIHLLILMFYFPIFVFYFLFWKVATRVVPPIKRIEKKMKEQKAAKEVLKLVCDEIEKLEFPDAHPLYYRVVLEAARQNIYEVVDEILMRSPKAVRYKDESGYDVIQLAVIHRSEKVYNLIHTIGERKSVYRTIEDSSKNNMLHLVGRLPPFQKLRHRRGPALQLQKELHWRQEIEKLVFPTGTIKDNTFKETPDKVFRREHENMVKEAEKWMKAVAESCSITAALITTIVFAAAITVPGGSNQETGIPVFTKEIAFTIFAVSDSISLFASSTALLMFLSILTGSFDERDFLVILPRRLMIGLCALMLSTTAMMVAFGATLFIVFSHKRPWMLAPICLLSSVPIATFGALQIPLIMLSMNPPQVHLNAPEPRARPEPESEFESELESESESESKTKPEPEFVTHDEPD
ncbi:unnamed protein product [Lactuca saligna]|uniref:PGG domain-containing protein n=1 Tax=Lactuca saligna TaxID=75948 RepID=A0AA35ZJ30_LACSI|nr:unnamed protein product [Lactuca saligna]